MKVANATNKPILLDGKQTLSIRMIPTVNSSISDPLAVTDYYDHYKQKPISHPPETETIKLIKFSKTEPEVKATLETANRQYRDVFNRDLSNGYKGYFGKHLCNLNWTSQQWPPRTMK